MTSPEQQPSAKVALFDMDGTLITPKDRTRKFAANREDWRLWAEQVRTELTRLHCQGYRIVIMSNQGGVAKGQTREDDLMGKIFDVCEALGFAVTALLALGYDQYRKPSPGMWTHFVQHLNNGLHPKQDLFFCGDAAGRQAKWDGNAKTKRDFSASDRMFAANIEAPFVTPEELFLKQQPTHLWSWGAPHPRELITTHLATLKGPAPNVMQRVGELEVVVMVGSPASGKSTLAKEMEQKLSMVRVCNDELGSKAKCLKIATDALGAKGKSVVVDNTNASIQHGAQVRCVFMDTPLDIAKHLNLYRAGLGVKLVPDVAFNTYRSKFSLPSVSEGFHSVSVMPFSVSEQDVDRIFSLWLD